MLEWSINWCTASRLHRYFMIHAAVAARDDRAMILPAWSGSGKSTLCAALIQKGWRLLSDEFCLLSLTDGSIHPTPRPIPLKNEAIAAFRAFAPNAVIGPTFYQTRKGDIAHVRPPPSSIQQSEVTAKPAWVVLPRYRADGKSDLEPVEPGRALMLMAANSFNFNLLGTPAFDALSRMMKTVSCHRIAYSDLDDAVASLEKLVP
jgi:HprK-related kinase A